MAEKGYVPERRCISCRKKSPQDSLIRITDTDSGLQIRNMQNLKGRSCYICRNINCINKAFEKNFIAKSLRHSVSTEELSVLKEKIKTII